jgi:hypothetical protein
MLVLEKLIFLGRFITIMRLRLLIEIFVVCEVVAGNGMSYE